MDEINIGLLRERLPAAAAVLQTNNKNQGVQSFADCLKLLEWAVLALLKIAELRAIDYNRMKVKGKTVAAKLQALLKTVDQAKQAFRRNDFVGLADIIQSEMLPEIDSQRETVAAPATTWTNWRLKALSRQCRIQNTSLLIEM